MTHTFTVPQDVFEALQGTRRHLFVKDSAKYATEDKAIIQLEEADLNKLSDNANSICGYRDELSFVITMIEHGPGSKHVSSRMCLIGLYAPYTAQDDVPDGIGGTHGHADMSKRD